MSGHFPTMGAGVGAPADQRLTMKQIQASELAPGWRKGGKAALPWGASAAVSETGSIRTDAARTAASGDNILDLQGSPPQSQNSGNNSKNKNKKGNKGVPFFSNSGYN
jgi:hypothetical protein